jgi:UDP-glucose:(heptosyl)LPS alpha-1,3-glucosyltransferase
MRIGLAINNFDPKKGGAERYAFDLSTNLVKRGHDVSVFCARGVSLQGVTLERLNTVTYPRWLRSLSFALSHRRQVKTRNLDVMLGFGNVFEADVYQSHGGVQRVWMEREIASYDNPRERQLKAFLLKQSLNQKVQEWIQEYPIRTGRYKKIVAISDMIKGHMAHHFGLGEKAFRVVYNGVNTERFRPGGDKKQGDVTKFLFSAGNFRLKGLSPLLLAVGELSKERGDFHLSVLGRGRKERYQQLIETLNISGLITFLGETAGPERVYGESHVCVHPTFYDACSLTTMEAMASGLPTITTRWNGASALVSPEEGYVLDDARDVTGLASAMRDVMDGDRRNRMGKRARLKLEGYTIERNAMEMEKILAEAAHG